MVGINRFVEDEETPIEILKIDPRPEREQAQRLEKLRRTRDEREVKARLEGIRQTARGKGNLMPPILEAVRDYDTLGEMVEALRDVFGSYREPAAF